MKIQLTKSQRILWAAAGVAIVGYLGLFIWTETSRQDLQNNPRVVADNKVILPDFQLLDHTGASVDIKKWRGQWLLVFFGFTNCPDVCPTTLAEMTSVINALGDDSSKVKPLFISIDPERDRVAEMAEYVAAFHPSITGLTGTSEQIAAAAKNFRAFYERQNQESAPDGYTMAHTSAIYLVTPKGQFERLYSFGTGAKEILNDLKARL